MVFYIQYLGGLIQVLYPSVPANGIQGDKDISCQREGQKHYTLVPAMQGQQGAVVRRTSGRTDSRKSTCMAADYAWVRL